MFPASYTLPPAAVATLLSDPVGKLRPNTQEDAPERFALLDTFDHAVTRRHPALIETAETLHLLCADGSWMTQSLKPRVRFVADLPDGPVRRPLEAQGIRRSLQPLCEGTAVRGMAAFVDDEGKTHVRLHLLTMHADAGPAVTLLTLSGLRGYEKALERLRTRIETLGGTPVQSLLPMLAPDAQPFVSRPAITITATDRAFDTATNIIAAHLPLARQNEQGVLDDLDTEFLKHYRVALRKVRSVLSLFKGVYGDSQTDHLKAEFSNVMAVTGRLRDLDVYLHDRQSWYDKVPPEMHGGLDRMFALFAKERKRELSRLRRHLRSGAYAARIARLEKLFRKRSALQKGPKAKMPVGDFAARLIWKRYRKICGIAAGITELTPDDDVHELRIQCKKLRYLMEFFTPLYGEAELKPLIKALKKLQTTLGNFNDCSVQQDSLKAFVARLGPDTPDAIEIAQSVGALVAVLHQKQLEERARVTERFAAFNSPVVQAQFETLFHAPHSDPAITNQSQEDPEGEPTC